jgi:hypothetical protein
MSQTTNALLKQAIADAEAVRETAVANAKLVLEEAITPQIRSMIANRLRLEAEHGDEEAEDVEAIEEAAPEVPHEEGDAEGGSEFPADSSTVGTGDNKEPSDDAFDASGIGDGGENASDSNTDWYDDWSDSDFDLSEVIRELEEDIAALSGGTGEEEEEIEEGDDVDTQTHPHAHAHAGLKRDAMDADEVPEAPTGDSEGDEELDLEQILRELEADDDMGDEESSPDTAAMAAELDAMKKEVAAYKEAVMKMRESLQEVNLLNAKLLFTNKMFRKDSLTNEQKVRIIESFDRATTVREVKLVYTALVENLSTAAKTFNAASRKTIVAEGLASKATRSTAPTKQEVIVENTVANRLQELAGIIR